MSSSPLRLESDDDVMRDFVAQEVQGDADVLSDEDERGVAPAEPPPFDAGRGVVSAHPGGAAAVAAAPLKENTVIWGTTVNIKETMTDFHRFLSTYDAPRNGRESRYTSLIRQVIEKEMSSMNLDCKHLYDFNEELYNHMVRFPQEVIPIFDIVLSDYASGLTGEDGVELQIRPFNLIDRDLKKMRQLNPKDIDQLLCIQGMIIRSSAVVPDLRQAFFRCLVCSHEVQVDIDRGRIKEPTQCTHCHTRNTYQLIHNRSLFSDKQYIKLQETVESIPEGETPHTVTLCVYDALVDVARPGDKVLVTGIYRAHPIRPSTKNRQIRQVYRTYLDVVHFRRLGKRSDKERRSAEANIESEFFNEYEETHELTIDSDIRKAAMEEIGHGPNVYQRLVNSFAPSIWSLEDVKKGVLCMLFGGASKSFKRKNEGKFRSDINVLLCGDPGTSKSQLLQYVHKIAPRGIYTSGKGSSAVGLTAYVSRDPDTGEAVLESGALVLSDQGVCCIDEFDKMDDMTRSILHEAMEQQTVSVAKAGIICSLNARTSILASANPRESKYNPSMSVVDNLQLPPTLLSRFDLIYLILDKADPETDRKLANHLVALYFENPESRASTSLSTVELGDYISYAKAQCNPTISNEAADRLVEGYVEMRQVGAGIGAGKRVVSATTRQLESCIRLSEALARMELSPIVRDNHVQEALRLMKAAIQAAATDPRTGQIDMDLITTGRSATSRSVLKDLYSALKAHIQELPAAHTIPMNDLFTQFKEQSSLGEVSRTEFEEVLTQLAEEDVVLLGGPPRSRTVRRLY